LLDHGKVKFLIFFGGDVSSLLLGDAVTLKTKWDLVFVVNQGTMSKFK